MKGLFLDDERNPEDVTWIKYPECVEWTVVRNKTQSVACFLTRSYDIISFDHDIQDFSVDNKETTGYDILKEMLNYSNFDMDKTEVFFHTQNPIGKKNMESYYQNYLNFMKRYL